MSRLDAVFVLALTVVAFATVIGLVPLAAELIMESGSMARHRERLRRMGPPGALTAKLLPERFDDDVPLHVWIVYNALTWLLFTLIVAWRVAMEPEDLLHNLGATGLVVGGFWATAGAIILLGRAIARANAAGSPAGAVGSRAGEPAEPDWTPMAVTTVTNLPDFRRLTPAALRGWLWQLAEGFVVAVAVGLVSAVAPQIAPLRALTGLTEHYRSPLLSVTVTMGALGFLAFMGGSLALVLGGPSRRMPRSRVARSMRQSAGRGAVWERSTARFQGEGGGREGSDAFTLTDLKRAVWSGAWRVDPEWRRRAITTVGALCLAVGLFGSLIVVGPPGIKVLLLGVLAYAAVRLTWALSQA